MESFKLDWKRRIFFVLMLVLLPVCASASPLSPSPILDPAESAQLNVNDSDFANGNKLIFHDSIDFSNEETLDTNGEFSICCDQEVNEFDSTATVTVSRSGGSTGAVSVDYLTGAFPGTATSDVDYGNTFGTLTWDDGDMSDRTIDIPIIDDDEYEDLEYFFVDIVDPTGGATLDPIFFFAEVDILDDELPVGSVVINSFSASPSMIDIGDSITLSWDVSNAISCTPTDGTAGWSETFISLPSGSAQLTLTKAGSFSFGLSCTDDLTGDIANTTVDVIGPPPVVIDSFTASPGTIDPGQSATLSWSVSNADSCTAVGGTEGWAGSSISLPTGSTQITFPEAGTFIFELNCSNVSSAVLSNATVTVTAPPQVMIDAFTASQNPVAEGDSTMLSWSVSNAESCMALDGTGGWAGSEISLPSGSLSVTFADAGSFTFTLQCSNSFGSSDMASTTVTVEANPPVVIDAFAASPNPLALGESTTLSWTVSNADSCMATDGAGGWAGSEISLPSGSQSVTFADAGSFTFTLQCSNSFGSSDMASTTVTVEANPPVVIDAFAASPNPLALGESTTLSWTVSNADSCMAADGAGGWAGSVISLPSGSQSVTLPDAGSYTFTLQCSNSMQSSDTASTTVTVEANPPVVINSFTASPNPIDEGQATTLSWTVSNADSCTASGGADGWDGSMISVPTGSQPVTLSTEGSYNFTLQCSNLSGSSDTATATVTVAAPATVVIASFTASPNPILEGAFTTLSWSVSNADSCIASGGAGGWAGSLISLPNGSQSVTLSAAGFYTFTLQCSNSSESADNADITVIVQEDADPEGFINAGHSGAWFNPDTPGQGVFLDVETEEQFIFLSWFTYTDADSANPFEQRWFTAQGKYNGAVAELELYETLGGRFDDPQAVSSTPVGSVILLLSDCYHALLMYIIDAENLMGEFPLERVIPGSGNVCEDLAANSTEAVDINAGMDGAWFDPETSGQGFFVDAHPDPVGGDFIFVSWFTYGDDTASGLRWLTAQGNFTGSIAELEVSETTGGSFDDPLIPSTSTVGTMTLDFDDCSNAQLTYSLPADPAGGEIAITRVVPGGQALCEVLTE